MDAFGAVLALGPSRPQQTENRSILTIISLTWAAEVYNTLPGIINIISFSGTLNHLLPFGTPTVVIAIIFCGGNWDLAWDQGNEIDLSPHSFLPTRMIASTQGRAANGMRELENSKGNQRFRLTGGPEFLPMSARNTVVDHNVIANEVILRNPEGWNYSAFKIS